MLRTSEIRTPLAALVTVVALAGALSACSSDEPKREPAATPSASQTPVTEPTELSFGDAETVTWKPSADLSAKLSLQVDSVREGDTSDFAGLVSSGITKDNQPYYVDVVVTNEGDAEIGGLDVPLYLVDSQQTLTPPAKFAAPFKPCPSGPLPTTFGAGDTTEMCLVFLSSVGATFQSITFQPTSDAAVVAWTGDVAVPAQKPIKKQRPRPKD